MYQILILVDSVVDILPLLIKQLVGRCNWVGHRWPLHRHVTKQRRRKFPANVYLRVLQFGNPSNPGA